MRRKKLTTSKECENGIFELDQAQIEAVSGAGCGLDAAAGGLVGARIGLLFSPVGAAVGGVAGALLSGAFCLAGEAIG